MASPGERSRGTPQTPTRLSRRHQQHPDMDQHETPNTLATTHLHRTINTGEPDVQASRWPNSRLNVTRSPTLAIPGRDSRGPATRPSINIARPDIITAPGSIGRSNSGGDAVPLKPKSTNTLTVENLGRLQRYLEYLEILDESRGKAINDWAHKVGAATKSKSTKDDEYHGDNDDADREEYTEFVLKRYREEDEPVVPGPVFRVG